MLLFLPYVNKAEMKTKTASAFYIWKKPAQLTLHQEGQWNALYIFIFTVYFVHQQPAFATIQLFYTLPYFYY
jgi:hypothetical protein